MIVLVVVCAQCAGGCGRRARLEMGGLSEGDVPSMAENAAGMGCELRRGLLRVALRCPGIVYPESSVDMVIYMNGRVECVAPRDQEDDCPVVAEALLR
jgi:hypothetical protein